VRPASRYVTATALLLAALLATPAQALQIGMSDQHARMFDQPLYRRLHTRLARLVVPWDIALKPVAQRRPTAAWIAGALRAGAQPSVAFTSARYNSAGIGVAPTRAQYRRAFAAFRRRWPIVHVFTPWNEVNLRYQPTRRRPALAATYYEVLRWRCPRCTVVAADLLDTDDLQSWLRGFLGAVHGSPRLWGLHNYRDANRHHPLARSWTLRLTKLVRGRIWVTEGGGIVGMRSALTGRTRWSYSPRRAAASLRHLLTLVTAPAVRARYTRLYDYCYFGTWGPHRETSFWDSGLVGLDGRARPAYAVLRAAIRRLGG
jgi:hypothetical protein